MSNTRSDISNVQIPDDTATDKALHKNLVDQVSEVHLHLRSKFRGCNWEKEWEKHTRNREVLESYSKAMHELATSVWEPKHHNLSTAIENNQVKCRIEWVSLKCQEYFKDNQSKLKLLDVGSCYNPFKKYEQLFDITALDLQPAPGFEKSIYRCDFLKLGCCPTGTPFESNLVIESDREIVELIGLPEGYFDIIIFSFVLEYMPSPQQRLDCCKKAKLLLKPNGLLFTLRPDSNPVTENSSKCMKQWKVGLGYLGFKRVFYEKLEHFWGAAYSRIENEELGEEFLTSKRFLKDVRKVSGSADHVDVNELHKLFAIPQDFVNNTPDFDFDLPSDKVSTSQTVNSLFSELPFTDSD